MADTIANTLFFLDEFGNFVVNKPEARKIKEFEVLFKRDKGLDGKNKRLACAEIYLIYLVYDIRSQSHNLPYDERFERGKEIAKIPERWRIDKDWLAAVNRYQLEFELSSTGKAYAVAERGAFIFAKDVEMMQEGLINNKQLLEVTLKRIKRPKQNDADLDLSNIQAIKDVTAIMLDMVIIQEKMMGNVKKFPDYQKTVKDLASAFLEEGGSLEIKVGGEEIGNRER